jgi:ankyrin repeat protein
VNATCYNRFTPLYFAASFGQLDILQYLIMKGANVEAPSNGGTPIQAAARNPEILRALLDAGATYDLDTAISRSDEAGVRALLARTPALAGRERILSTACGRGHVGIVSLLIENGADPNERSGPWKDSPLFWALSYPPVVKLLLEKGADPKIRLHLKGVAFGSTLLHEAARKGELESARLLIAHGAAVDAVYVDEVFKKSAADSGFTPLHSAAAAGHPQLAELLLEQKADLHRRTSNGQNALQLAAGGIRLADAASTIDDNRRYAEVVKIFASRGLEIDLFTAIALGDHEKVTTLLKAKPERVGEKDPAGSLPLHRAVGLNQLQIADALLAAGADVNAVGRYGWTPLIEAAFWGRLDMVKLLLQRGAKPDATAERGATALSEAERVLPHSARKQEYEEVIKLLKERTPH